MLNVPSESLARVASLVALFTVLQSVATRLGLNKDVGKAHRLHKS